MTFFYRTALFMLGFSLAVQWLAALFGIIDLWRFKTTAYLRMLRPLLAWSLLMALPMGLPNVGYRLAFYIGAVSFILFNILFFLMVKLIRRGK